MKRNYALVAGILLAGAAGVAIVTEAAAQARGGAQTEYLRNGKSVEQITCRDFTATQDRFKPEVLSYAIGYGKHGHAHDAVVDVGGINRLVPVVVQSCTARPDDSLLARLATMKP